VSLLGFNLSLLVSLTSLGAFTFQKSHCLCQTNPKPDEDDLKQMYVYNMYWEAKKSMLLYPNSTQTDESFRNFWKGRDSLMENQCKVGFVNILNPDLTLNYSIGKEILSKLD